MTIYGNNIWSGLRLPLSLNSASGSRANTPLNGAYVHGTSGPAIAIRTPARVDSKGYSEIYFFLDDIVGTLANITMECRVYREHATSITQPGSSVYNISTSVVMPNAVDKWIKCIMDPLYATTILGETNWLVLFNTSAAPTVDYPLILNATSFAAPLNTMILNISGYSTTNGWSTAGGALTRVPHIINQEGAYFGQPLTLSSNAIFTSNTAMKGFQIKPPIDIEVGGIQIGSGNAAFTGFRIYDPATPPAGTPLYTFNFGTDPAQNRDELIGAKVIPPFVMRAGKTYNCVLTYSGTATQAGALIEDYASFPAMFDTLTDSFTVCSAVWDVGGVWTYRPDFFPSMQLLITGFPMAGSRANFALGI